MTSWQLYAVSMRSSRREERLLVTGGLLLAGLSCNPGGQVAYRWLFSKNALLSALLFPPHQLHWEGEARGLSVGNAVFFAVLQNP